MDERLEWIMSDNNYFLTHGVTLICNASDDVLSDVWDLELQTNLREFEVLFVSSTQFHVILLQTSRRFVSSCISGTTSGPCGLLPGLVAGRLRGAALQQDIMLHNHGECPFGGLERRHCELYLKSWLSCWCLNNTEARGDFVISPVQLFTLMEFWCSVFSEKLTLSTIIKIN